MTPHKQQLAVRRMHRAFQQILPIEIDSFPRKKKKLFKQVVRWERLYKTAKRGKANIKPEQLLIITALTSAINISRALMSVSNSAKEVVDALRLKRHLLD